jgi:FAS-associated factor 2
MRARRGRGISPDRDANVGLNIGSSRIRSSVVPPVPQKSVMAVLKEAITGQMQGESSSSAARRFAAEFDKLVGTDADVPDFFESSFEDALLSASTDRRMLAVYLHSPLHPDTDRFCREVLCSRPVLAALADVRVWGGSLNHVEGYLASTKLQAAGFPCLVLIATDRGRDAKIIDRLYVDDINEPNLPDRFAMRINAARNFRTTAVVQPPISAADQRVMDERRRVVEEQDVALRQAMEDDRRREEEKRTRERQEEEERRKREAEERKQEEELHNKRQRIRPEPDAGTGTATIRFHFPGGSKLSRRFQDSDKVGYLREVLDIYLVDQLKTPRLRYALILNYPKKTLDDFEMNLKDAGLVPQAVLMLQDLDA